MIIKTAGQRDIQDRFAGIPEQGNAFADPEIVEIIGEADAEIPFKIG